MQKLIISFLSLALFLAIAAPASASIELPKKNICHPSASEENPWQAVRVSIFSHLGNGHENDFAYNGPVNPQNNQPTSDEWCDNNQPGDVCQNIDGKQSETPEGYTNTEGDCQPIEEEKDYCDTLEGVQAEDEDCPPVEEEPDPEPEATPSATPKAETPTTLPDTGYPVKEVALLIGTLGLAAGWAIKRTLRD